MSISLTINDQCIPLSTALKTVSQSNRKMLITQQYQYRSWNIDFVLVVYCPTISTPRTASRCKIHKWHYGTPGINLNYIQNGQMRPGWQIMKLILMEHPTCSFLPGCPEVAMHPNSQFLVITFKTCTTHIPYTWSDGWK